MELSLPTKLAAEKRLYRHFTIESQPVKEIVYGKKTEFFYIGADHVQIDLLIKNFGGGYAFEDVKTAIPFLDRLAARQAASDMIIVDGRLGDKAIKELYNYISTSSCYNTTPLLLDASGLSETELKKYRKLSCIDEIVFLKDISREKLLAKVNFLIKVKSSTPNDESLKKNIQVSGRISASFSFMAKRIFDILVSGALLLLLSPLFLVIALFIKFGSKGPIFYISPRAGKGYKVFNFYKFRTMIVDADKKVEQLSHLNQYTHAEDGPVFFKVSNDPRITKIGAFLRNTSLDELPQLLNVFLGDMSLVGNRPLPLYEAATLTTDEYAARFMAPAGITGLWQIKKRGDSNMSVEERINLDINYAEKSSFTYDLWIMAKTPTALLQKENV
ncbi:MAG TPA: sugar transferase [Chitinophagaceae bacterium]|nr:sugar transferase [Chitinophagaceae bacterium]